MHRNETVMKQTSDTVSSPLEALLEPMAPVTLEEMRDVKLMDRDDRKYIAASDSVPPFLEMAAPRYFVQEVCGSKISTYDTVYYDTHDMNMYLTHHDGRKEREKIRVRTYVESHLTFLEIKSKDNKSKTHKHRIQIEEGAGIGGAAALYIDRKSAYKASDLQPSLEISFRRITLVNLAKTERLTLDTDLVFNNLRNGSSRRLEGVAIIESKTAGNTGSDARRMLNDLRVKPDNFSKYCIGCVLTDGSLKRNLFNEKLRRLDKITNYRYHYAY